MTSAGPSKSKAVSADPMSSLRAHLAQQRAGTREEPKVKKGLRLVRLHALQTLLFPLVLMTPRKVALSSGQIKASRAAWKQMPPRYPRPNTTLSLTWPNWRPK